jgi:hypothetical protein
MKFKLWMENNFYHGSTNKFDNFSFTFLGKGKGYDENGPGFYFTSNKEDALHYGQHQYEVKLHLKKTVPLKGKIKRKEVEFLIKNAPNLYDTLTDWGEEPQEAFRYAVNSISNNDSPHDVFQTIWHDFYLRQNATDQYLTNMIKLGYDGVIIPKNELVHVVVFNPQKIEMI